MTTVEAPPSFATVLERKTLEIKQAMNKAIKEEKYEEALEHARTVLMLEPGLPVMVDFVKLLDEKIALDNDEEESGDESEDESESESDGDSSSENDSEESSSDEDETPDEPVPVTVVARTRTVREEKAMQVVYQGEKRLDRLRMKASLARQVLKLKAIEMQQQQQQQLLLLQQRQ